MRNLILLVAFMASLTFSCMPDQESTMQKEDWKAILEKDLHLLGHRNWILVVDKAFPEQSSPGMKYLYVDEDLLPTLSYVLEQVEASSHVRPIIYRDKELNYISNDQVPGIDAFRTQSNSALEGKIVNTILHDEVFQMLDKSSSLFRTLVIKTNCTLPYTSVFLQLDCAYWGPENEKILRDQISQDKPAINN
ncbi:MAG: hypothetical protein U9R49_06755 [Bacteroidota bacterium]|nr:hypothetical protein [Bacteroidota bacterium]